MAKAKKTAPATTEMLNEMDLATLAALEPTLAKEIMEEAPVEVMHQIDASPIAVDDDHPAEDMIVTEVPAKTLTELVQDVTDADRGQMLAKIEAQFVEREDFERTLNPGNSNIQDTLKKQRKKMALPGIAGMMLATNVDPGIINRSISEGKRFNVYAIDKLNDLLHGLNSGHFKNEINLAVMRSLFKFRAAGVPFTGIAAAASASDKVVVDKALKGLLVRHTVSASTAPTQSSSTMSALQALGVVTNKGSAKYPIWELTDAPVTKALEAKFG